MNNKKGFTLVELLVVIVILGIVTGLSIPLIRNIQNNNQKKEYTTYMDTLKYSAKLYVDSYGEDLFGKRKTGCAIISYSDLEAKGLLKDIPIDNVSCASGETFVKVVKLDNKYGYSTTIGCGKKDSEGNITIDTTLSNTGSVITETCDIDAKTIMSFNATPSSSAAIKYRKRNVKLTITSDTGINDNMQVYYGFSYNKDTNVINNNWRKLPVVVPGKKSQKEKVLSGNAISITTDNLTTPTGVTGDLYLVIRIDKLENLSTEAWTTENKGNFLYFGPYTVDNTKPKFNDSTIVSSETGFNSVRPKLQLKVTDEKYSSANDLRMCITYDNDTCPTGLNDTRSNKYEKYDANKVLPAIQNTYDSSTHTIYVTVADAAGNYEKKQFTYRIARRWTLTYDSNGGSACNPASITKTFNDWESNITWGTLCAPTRTNFRFLGWKNQSGNYVTSSSPVNSNITATGDWEALYTFSFRYTGTFSYQDGNAGWVTKTNDSVDLREVNWQVKFLSSGTLTVLGSLSNVDVFLVGGGGGAGGCNSTRGGGGGGGGYTTTQTNISISNTNYPIAIGNGGACGRSGGTSTALGYSAAGGGAGSAYSNGRGGNGGSGGGGNFGGNGFPSPTGAGGSNGSNGSDGRVKTYAGNGNINEYNHGGSGCASNNGCTINGSKCSNTRAFCESNGELYAGGGAGGDHEYCGVGGSGGGGGSGRGGWCVCGCPGKAQANKGGGGAMAGGSSGIVIIRNTR